jgi:hypothetical protein
LTCSEKLGAWKKENYTVKWGNTHDKEKNKHTAKKEINTRQRNKHSKEPSHESSTLVVNGTVTVA